MLFEKGKIVLINGETRQTHHIHLVLMHFFLLFIFFLTSHRLFSSSFVSWIAFITTTTAHVEYRSKLFFTNVIQSFSIHGERGIHSFAARKGIDCINNIVNPRYRAGDRDYEDQTTDNVVFSCNFLT